MTNLKLDPDEKEILVKAMADWENDRYIIGEYYQFVRPVLN